MAEEVAGCGTELSSPDLCMWWNKRIFRKKEIDLFSQVSVYNLRSHPFPAFSLSSALLLCLLLLLVREPKSEVYCVIMLCDTTTGLISSMSSLKTFVRRRLERAGEREWERGREVSQVCRSQTWYMEEKKIINCFVPRYTQFLTMERTQVFLGSSGSRPHLREDQRWAF